MNSANITFYSHIAVELFLIGGISFYFYKRQANLQSQIDELKKQNQELAQLIANQNSYLKSLIGEVPASTSTKKGHSRSSHTKSSASALSQRSTSSKPKPQAQQASHVPQQAPPQKPKPKSKPLDKKARRKHRSDVEEASPEVGRAESQTDAQAQGYVEGEVFEELPPDDDEDEKSGFDTEDLDRVIDRECEDEGGCPIDE